MSTITKMQQLLGRSIINESEFPTKLTRNFGGSTRANSPFVSGGFLFYLLPPGGVTSIANTGATTAAVVEVIDNAFGGDARKYLASGSKEVSHLFHCTAENFTPHSRTITTNTVPGLFGVKASFATSQDISTTFSMTMREQTNMPIVKTIRLWQNLMFDANHGLSLTTSHLANSYKGDAIVFYIKPNISNGILTAAMVEEMFWYTGVFPTTADIPASDISAPDLQTIPVTFSFDGHPFTMENSGMLEKAISLITTMTNGSVNSTTDKWFSFAPQGSTDDKAFS